MNDMAKRADKKRNPAPQAPPDEAPPSDAPDAAAETAPDAVAAAEAPEGAEAAAESAPAEASPEDRLAAFETEAADLKDKLLRALAEAENVRRRAERDRADASKYAVANFAREMLKATDNLRRALETVTDEARRENEALESLAVGLEITEREMLNAFERVGIRPIEALGQRFDHNLHEAMFELDDPDRPAGTVVQVLETGYVLHDRLLRPAKVGVGKGGPAPLAEDGAPAPMTEDGAPAPVAENGAPAPTAEDQAPPTPSPKTATAKAYEKKDAAAGAKLDEKL